MIARMLTLCALVVLHGCAKETAPPAEAPSSAPAAPDPGAWQPDARDQELVRALSVRDPEPSCDRLDALVDDPAASLQAIVENVQMPPWVPMRAASCLLVRHPEAARPIAVEWVRDPGRQGLARLALGHLDVLPADIAVVLAVAALEGPDPDLARAKILDAREPRVRALVEPAP